MRLITYLRQGNERIGAWLDDDRLVVDLLAAAERMRLTPTVAFSSMQALIDGGPSAWNRARAIVASPPDEVVFPSAQCTILAPLPRPAQIRDCLCFPEHLRNGRRIAGEQLVKASPDPAAKRAALEAAGYFDVPKDFYDFPVYYISNRMSVVGPDVDVVWPTYSNYIDYELEWAAVIGKAGIAIPRAEAHEYVFGYTIFNDWSARDEQMRVMGGSLSLGPGQGKDFANGIGPCVVTADEIPDPYRLEMRARINGQEVSAGSTASMHWKFEDLIVHISRAHSIFPGELLCSGTIGNGCSLETGHVVAPGDVIELDVERIGVLRNRVLAPHMSAASRVTSQLADGLASMLKAR
jgi:2-keto-4-pentenoate hydratase/2-oxohepta-3-ene-1,7-dioic acid hydratase in catechol pathway